ncbi:AAA family ATPase [Shewanella sp. MBTL60-007]|uniref:AAA family ATPase n=1 Tax=Shewanella sp. MBTL60-007 TaxID=2815911 RepID=UPI001BB9214E|nr:AAA family ATPase [Shewanella sp. MBTL60-007]GIU32505.1 hypothetical protein TUM3792_45070 [Shewanella sp. MBTL60-007]
MEKKTIEQPEGISLRYAEVCKFRRLDQVLLDVDERTTILVGANNSGKTSILAALRLFLSDSTPFGAFDISQSQWKKLRGLGKRWEALAEDPTSAGGEIDNWQTQLTTLLSAMPTIDLWFNADQGMYHYVAPFLSKLTWKGGAVGIRLRLEPASNVDELQQLAWRYREARDPVKDMGADSLAWPLDLLDYWLREPRDMGRVHVYKLDTDNSPMEKGNTYTQQVLSANATQVNRLHLSQLIRVDFVAAQRGLGGEEADSRTSSEPHSVGLFSNQLLKFARQHLNVAANGYGNRAEIITSVAKAQQDLDKTIQDAITPIVEDVKELGYPGLQDPQKIHFRTRIQTADLLNHSTAVQYSMSEDEAEDLLPEYSIGLGYQNLQSLSYQLVSFKTARLNPPKGSPAPVHLVMIEEPEAHLHVQVQRIFPGRAHKLISLSDQKPALLNSQLLLSTHSSHLAHAESFARLRYVRRVAKTKSNKMPCAEIISLGEVFGNDEETRLFAERYFRVQHTDLLFANAAIFVEGVAERMLVPLFVERDFKELSNQYVSFLDIGGSHAHRLRPLIEKLRIPTVVITDIDPVEVTKNKKGKTIRTAVANTGQPNLECGNPTLNIWHPRLTKLEDFKNPEDTVLIRSEGEDYKVRFAWQLPVLEADACWPSSFEDSLILSNISWFRGLSEKKLDEDGNKLKKPTGALGAIVKKVAEGKSNTDLAKALHELMHKSFNKGDFAATIFENIASGEKINCPNYIAEALAWLQKQLKPDSKVHS